MVDGPVTERSSAFKQIKFVVQWRHSHYGQEAHCLARFILLPAPRPIVAVLSELRSNPDDLGIADNFSEVAEAALVLAAPKIGVSGWLFDIVWVAHHGAFSYYDSPALTASPGSICRERVMTTTCAATIC